jgi:hypothetical protein
MPSYRATVRWLADRQHYHVEDLDAPDLFTALERLRAAIPDEVAAAADLLEVRARIKAEEREFSPE